MLVNVISKCNYNSIFRPLYSSIAKYSDTFDFSVNDTERLPNEAKVIISGGGVIGASVAYYLAELGWGPDTIVLEQSR